MHRAAQHTNRLQHNSATGRNAASGLPELLTSTHAVVCLQIEPVYMQGVRLTFDPRQCTVYLPAECDYSQHLILMQQICCRHQVTNAHQQLFNSDRVSRCGCMLEHVVAITERPALATQMKAPGLQGFQLRPLILRKQAHQRPHRCSSL